MKHKTWFVAGGTVAVLALALAWDFAPRPVEVELAPVAQGRFETTIDEDGKTRLADRYVISAPLAGRLARITLKEADAVAVDTPLALLASVLPAMLDERTLREMQALGDGYRVGVRILTLADAKAVQVPVSAVYPLPADGAGNAEAGRVACPARKAPRKAADRPAS